MRKLKQSTQRDQVGLSWRPELAAGILQHLDQVDLVEVIADDYFDAPTGELSALQLLGAQLPLAVHGLGLGLASATTVSERHLDRLARFIGRVQPPFWSEHLAFVRAGGLELHHLAAPPRTEATIAGSVRNLQRVRQVVGSAPLLENISTLLDPPGSELSEATWLKSIADEANAPLLLDLHNLYTNAQNLGFDALEYLASIPLSRVQSLHIAGGKWLTGSGRRLRLDDHLHPVPGPVYELLSAVASRTSQPLVVILERDGHFPPFAELLAELGLARDALAQGRAQRTELRDAV